MFFDMMGQRAWHCLLLAGGIAAHQSELVMGCPASCQLELEIRLLLARWQLATAVAAAKTPQTEQLDHWQMPRGLLNLFQLSSLPELLNHSGD